MPRTHNLRLAEIFGDVVVIRMEPSPDSGLWKLVRMKEKTKRKSGLRSVVFLDDGDVTGLQSDALVEATVISKIQFPARSRPQQHDRKSRCLEDENIWQTDNQNRSKNLLESTIFVNGISALPKQKHLLKFENISKYE
ncbi:hypothetical protein EMPG_09357 [Blastomyces silverae]|uniref:DUF5641 domain-containing protein n=1 Tax=Blastomyces silverae TaxID=2060906 RepID=A0A0H1B3R2_9EURO|nr:hypothetical protein EMPG_09357 [Blastomyces silverae]